MSKEGQLVKWKSDHLIDNNVKLSFQDGTMYEFIFDQEDWDNEDFSKKNLIELLNKLGCVVYFA